MEFNRNRRDFDDAFSQYHKENIMVTLVKCPGCGKKVSSLAKECPHCHQNPKTKTCKFCGRQVKVSDVEMHSEVCVQRFITLYRDLQQFSCPACHKVIKYHNSPKVCPKCGHPFTITQCLFCKQPVEQESAVKRSHRIYLHSSCRTRMESGSWQEIFNLHELSW